jgi:transcriptional regulator GlxA family with amidase domain
VRDFVGRRLGHPDAILVIDETVSEGGPQHRRRSTAILRDRRAITVAQPEAEPYRLVMTAAARLLAASVLTAFPSTAQREPTFTDRLDAHPATLRRAMTFIEAHPDLDLTVADVAHAAHVSVRAIQVAFRRHLGTTPMAYLRRVRLDAARAELLNATPGRGLTVTAVASRWGWARPSRFAADFRAAYGQHPYTLLPPR